MREASPVQLERRLDLPGMSRVVGCASDAMAPPPSGTLKRLASHEEGPGEASETGPGLRLLSPAVFPALDAPCGRALITEFCDARATVERALATLAATRHTRDDMTLLEAAVSDLELLAHSTRDDAAQGAARLFAVMEMLHQALGRAARNRFLTEQSRMFFQRLWDGADWLAPRFATPSTTTRYRMLVDAVGTRDTEQAADVAQALADLVESWIWRRLAQP